jgi:hypothetical protein
VVGGEWCPALTVRPSLALARRFLFPQSRPSFSRALVKSDGTYVPIPLAKRCVRAHHAPRPTRVSRSIRAVSRSFALSSSLVLSVHISLSKPTYFSYFSDMQKCDLGRQRRLCDALRFLPVPLSVASPHQYRRTHRIDEDFILASRCRLFATRGHLHRRASPEFFRV